MKWLDVKGHIKKMKFLTGKLMLTVAAATIVAAPAMANDLRMDVHGTNTSVHLVAEAAEAGARTFIESMGDRGINFLGNQSMTEPQKATEFRKLLNDSFDMATIGRFSLGPNWNKATPAQQKEYQKLFNDMIVKVYSRRFSEYKGQKFEVSAARKENDKDSMVTSYIVPSSGPKVRVDWRVRNKNGGYKVVDILVEGVSMSMTQRSDFASVIQRGGGDVEVLLAHLRK